MSSLMNFNLFLQLIDGYIPKKNAAMKTTESMSVSASHSPDGRVRLIRRTDGRLQLMRGTDGRLQLIRGTDGRVRLIKMADGQVWLMKGNDGLCVRVY